jgi:radical SAM protein with 4Fe4S-binding SPASM domain
MRRKTKYPIINLQFIVMKHNEHEIEKIKTIAESLGVDRLVLKMVKVDTVEEAKEFLPTRKNLRRFNIENENLSNRGSENKICYSLWKEVTVWYDGNVVPCCYDYKAEYIFGNAFKENIKDIWNGQKFVNFRKQFLKDKNKIPICSNCPRTGRKEETTIDDIGVKQ